MVACAHLAASVVHHKWRVLDEVLVQVLVPAVYAVRGLQIHLHVSEQKRWGYEGQQWQEESACIQQRRFLRLDASASHARYNKHHLAREGCEKEVHDSNHTTPLLKIFPFIRCRPFRVALPLAWLKSPFRALFLCDPPTPEKETMRNAQELPDLVKHARVVGDAVDEHILLIHAHVIGGHSRAQDGLLAPVHGVLAIGGHVLDQHARPV